MAKYYTFLFVASICCFTALCVSAATVNVPDTKTGTDADPFNGNVETAFQALSQIDQSSNPFVTFFRDTTKKYIDDFEKDKKYIQDAVAKGTEMEKKIQSILLTLKNSNVTLPTELQSELEEIEKHAAAEFTKLKGVEDVKDIDGIHNRYKTKYTEIKNQIEALSTLALDEIKKDKAEKKTTQNGNGRQVQTRTIQVQNTQALLASGSTSTEESDSFVNKVKTQLIEFLKKSVPVFFTMSKDAETISKKMDVASSALSHMHDDLIKLEQMEYHLFGAHKDLFKTDFASLTRSSMAKFVFAIMIGMLF